MDCSESFDPGVPQIALEVAPGLLGMTLDVLADVVSELTDPRVCVRHNHIP